MHNFICTLVLLGVVTHAFLPPSSRLSVPNRLYRSFLRAEDRPPISRRKVAALAPKSTVPSTVPTLFERRQILSMISLATATAMSPSNVNAATTSTPSLPTTAVNPVLLDLVSVPPSLRNSIAAYSLPGCTVTCISLPSTRSQSVSLSVPTGSTSQPSTLRGLPHFCEHMLFLGTKKYPNSLESYLSQITGSSNAYTEPEFTTYYMSSVPDFNAVDRLLHFLIDPTFTLDSVSKEVNAVSSEHTKNLQSDVFRISELQKVRRSKELNEATSWERVDSVRFSTALVASFSLDMSTPLSPPLGYNSLTST